MSVQTVTGKVNSADLGVTLTHEHFNLNFKNFYTEPPQVLKPYFGDEIKLGNVGYIKQYPYASRTNLDFFGNDVDSAVVEEMRLYKKFGGGAIVENTSHGLGRNIALMLKVSKETGVHVIAGTGYYVELVQPQTALKLTVEQMYSKILQDLTQGCDEDPSVKCGFVGEVGSAWPISDFEKRAIQATALAQQETGCPVSFHPGRDHKAPEEILRIYTEAGGRAGKAVMSHLERTLKNTEEVLEFSQLGSYCQFDLFGTECSFYQFNVEQDMPSDAQRIEYVKALVEEKKLDKILLSHDIHTKHRLVQYGGHGFSHLMNNVLPKMEIKGIQKEDIKQITVTNPAVWLSR